MEMKGKVSNRKIKKVIIEYIERMYESFKEWGFCPRELNPPIINCPQRGHQHTIKFDKQRGWRKCDYGFTFPKNLIPPTPEELDNFFKQKEAEARFNMIDKFFKKGKTSNF